MSPPRSFDVVAGRVAHLAPVFREPLDSPYEISNALYEALRHVLHDVGGQPGLPVPFTEKIEEQWEMTPTSRANASAARRVELRGTPPGRERPRHPRHHDRCGTTTSGLDGIRTSVRGKGQRVSCPPYEVLLETVDPESQRQKALPELERTPDPWESSIQATCECLSWRGALDNLERRHPEDELGETTYRAVPVHARPVVVTAHTLMDRGAFTPEELRARMGRIRQRFNRA